MLRSDSLPLKSTSMRSLVIRGPPSASKIWVSNQGNVIFVVFDNFHYYKTGLISGTCFSNSVCTVCNLLRNFSHFTVQSKNMFLRICEICEISIYKYAQSEITSTVMNDLAFVTPEHLWPSILLLRQLPSSLVSFYLLI